MPPWSGQPRGRTTRRAVAKANGSSDEKVIHARGDQPISQFQHPDPVSPTFSRASPGQGRSWKCMSRGSFSFGVSEVRILHFIPPSCPSRGIFPLVPPVIHNPL